MAGIGGIDKATARAGALLMLLLLGGAALRGHLPDSPADTPPAEHPQASFLVVALLCAALGIIALAIITRLRDPRVAAGSLAVLAEGAVGRGGRPTLRAVLIGLGVISGWLMMTALLLALIHPHRITLPGPEPTATPAVDTARDVAPPQPVSAHHQPTGDMLGHLSAAALAMLLMFIVAAVVGVVARRRRRTAAPLPVAGATVPDAPSAHPGSLVRAAELGLAEIADPGRGPREAIIACYATMERELAHVPGAMPQDFDTPTEVLVRAVEHHALRADNATELVNLFAEARFSPHVMNEAHRDAAVRVLSLVLAELPRSAS